MKIFALSDLNRRRDELLEAAKSEPVILTKRGELKFVLVSIEEYRREHPPQVYTIADAPDEVIEELLAGINEYLDEVDSPTKS